MHDETATHEVLFWSKDLLVTPARIVSGARTKQTVVITPGMRVYVTPAIKRPIVPTLMATLGVGSIVAGFSPLAIGPAVEALTWLSAVSCLVGLGLVVGALLTVRASKTRWSLVVIQQNGVSVALLESADVELIGTAADAVTDAINGRSRPGNGFRAMPGFQTIDS